MTSFSDRNTRGKLTWDFALQTCSHTLSLLLCCQRQLIRTTWPRLVACDSDFEQIGVEVFLRIFSRHPELLSLFPFGVDVADHDQLAEMTSERLAATMEEVRQHPTFRNHAAAFASAIGMAVESLDDWDGDLTATLLQLGRMHSETEGFTVQNLSEPFSRFPSRFSFHDRMHRSRIEECIQTTPRG